MTATPHLTQSNGGVIGFMTAARMPVRTVLSGPSTGRGRRPGGRGRWPASPISSPSTWAAPRPTSRCCKTAAASSRPKPPCTAIPSRHRCSTSTRWARGGGSIAYIDAGGLLKVGPRSCGADPGPVCYDKGNSEPAVTDANVVLQTLNPQFHAGRGRMKIRQDLAQQAIGRLAERLGMGVMETAQGHFSRSSPPTWTRAIRVISVQRGHDPRDYTLMAFGGAGPLHAARLAKELEIGRVLVPRNPGILCAMGLLLTDLRADFAATRLGAGQRAVGADRGGRFCGLAERAQAWFEHENIAAADRRTVRTAGHALPRPELRTRRAGAGRGRSRRPPSRPWPRPSPRPHRHALRLRRRGRSGRDRHPAPEAVGTVAKAELRAHPDAGPDASKAITGRRPVWLPEARDFVETPIYDREALRPGKPLCRPGHRRADWTPRRSCRPA